MKPIDQILIHNSDTTVKPIIGNRDIEKQIELIYQPDKLPFLPWKAEDFAQQVETPRFEKHVADISKAIGGGMGANVLIYFESIIQNTNVANKLINTLFINYLAKMLGSIKSPILKTRICSVIGTLIRHATIIENEVAESGVCEMMVEMLKEKADSVRRKAVAALGEYLFYAATQMDDEAAGSVWNIVPATVTAVVRCLRPGEDDIVRFYACKTVENITSQSLSAGYLFSTIETSSLLINIFNGTKNENMRVSAAVALSHICRLNSNVFPTFFDLFGFTNYCNVLGDNVARVQQAFVTLLLFALKGSYVLVEKLYLLQSGDGDSFVPALAALLESSNPVVKAKTLLAVLLMLQNNIAWMPAFGAKGVYQHIDRLSKDSYKYLRTCIATLCDGVEGSSASAALTLVDDLNTKLGNRPKSSSSGGRSPKSAPASLESRFESDALYAAMLKTAPTIAPSPTLTNFRGALTLVNIMKDMSSSQALRSHIVTAKSLKAFSDLLVLTEAKEYEPVQYDILQLLEAFAATPKLLPGYCDVILQFLLPNIIGKIYSKNEELRCSCFKLVCDILAQYMYDEKYDFLNQPIIIAYTTRGIRLLQPPKPLTS